MDKRKYFESSRTEMLQFIDRPPVKVIEFGCGQGEFLKSLQTKYHCETWGVDMDDQSVKIARKNVDNVLHGDAYKKIEELPENYFDYIICNDFIEHLYSPELFFNTLRKNLTEDAVLICSLPNIRYWRQFLKYFFLKDWKYRDSGILDRTHMRFFTKKSMKRSIKEWGFEIEKVKGINPVKTPFFYFFNLLTLNFIGDMRCMQYGFRARVNKS